jgi:hypothetical protein
MAESLGNLLILDNYWLVWSLSVPQMTFITGSFLEGHFNCFIKS